jgi:hypothetical protein
MDMGMTRVKTYEELNSTLLFSFIYGAGMEPSPVLLQLFTGVLYQPWMIGMVLTSPQWLTVFIKSSKLLCYSRTHNSPIILTVGLVWLRIGIGGELL